MSKTKKFQQNHQSEREMPRNNTAWGFIMAGMGKNAGPMKNQKDKRTRNPKRQSWQEEV